MATSSSSHLILRTIKMNSFSIKLNKFQPLMTNFKFISTIKTNKPVEKTSIRKNATQAAASASSQTVIPPPNLEGQSKQYSPKIQQLVDDIAKLNLIEVSDLNELLRKKLNIKEIFSKFLTQFLSRRFKNNYWNSDVCLKHLPSLSAILKLMLDQNFRTIASGPQTMLQVNFFQTMKMLEKNFSSKFRCVLIESSCLG